MAENEAEAIEVVTSADVQAAEQAAADAEKLAADLEAAIATGQPGITIDEVEAQEKTSRFAKLFAKGQRVKAERYNAAVRRKRIRDLHDEVIETSPRNGDELVKALRKVETAARAFQALADAHDAQLREWARRVQELGVPDGQLEEGIGVNGIGQVRVGSVTIEDAAGKHRLRGLFLDGGAQSGGGLIVRAPGDTDAAAQYAALDRIGEGL